MVFELRRALLAKEERESARLMDFEFRLRARTLRLLAARIDADPDAMVALVAEGDDEKILGRLRKDFPDQDMEALVVEARAEARRLLITELGDPTPHRLG